MNTTARPIVSFALAAASLAAFTAAPAFADVQPKSTATATRQAIQAAIDSAGAGGTVTLGAGLFEIDSQLMVTNGVVLEGQGWDHTIIKQVATTHNANTRCVNIQGGATVQHVTLTGGSVYGNYESGGGAFVADGTISWCCITNNAADGGNNKFGGGISFYQSGGQVDHSIIADNLVRTTAADVARGGGIGIFRPYGAITIDSCLVYGNRAFTTGGKGQGGGISVDFQFKNHAISIRNTTIVGNQSGDAAGVAYGGAIHTDNDSNKKLAMLNCIVAGNTTAHSDTTVELSYPGAVDYCFFDVAGDKLGDHSLVGEPEFVDAENRDYHLGDESLAIRAGTPYEGIGNDLGNAPFHTTPSLGCYEFFGELVVVRPVFSPVTGTTFHPSLKVSLSCAMEGASIYYTTDDTDPDESSTPYTGPIEISATTTIKARAYKAGRNPSRIVTATYTRASTAQPPELEAVTVTPGAMTATVSGEIVSPGNNGATACDVYFAVGKRANTLGTPERIVAGATVSFAHSITGLTTETTYYYELTALNNAQTPASTAVRGEFTTTAGVKPVPGDSAATRKTIQDEIDAVAPTHGTVVLGNGLFEIDSQLMVTGGVTLVGQGGDLTIIKQTAATPNDDTRVVTIDGGATVMHVTLTGGRVLPSNNYRYGGGARIFDGTLSWCCVTNNQINKRNTMFGGGVCFVEGKGDQIDHCIVADNVASTTGGDALGGGGIGVYKPFGPVVIDSCLVYNNRTFYTGNQIGKGAGIGIDFQRQDQDVIVRNTTIAGNTAGGEGATEVSEGGSVHTSNDSKNRFSMFNCIVAGNTTVNTNITVKLDYAGGVDHCLFDVADDKLGEHSKVGDPKFVNLAKGNCHLSPGSAAIGIGQWYEEIPEDLDGLKRRRKPAAGCYEVKAGTLLILR